LQIGLTSFKQGSNAIENITTAISSFFYPKNIYGGPLFANIEAQTHFEFENKFKRNLKQKGKTKEKGTGKKERRSPCPSWAGLGE
jgi:hypothetical protein